MEVKLSRSKDLITDFITTTESNDEKSDNSAILDRIYKHMFEQGEGAGNPKTGTRLPVQGGWPGHVHSQVRLAAASSGLAGEVQDVSSPGQLGGHPRHRYGEEDGQVRAPGHHGPAHVHPGQVWMDSPYCAGA